MDTEGHLPAVVTAFNPIVYRSTQAFEGEESGEGVLLININGTQIAKKKEYFNGVADFNIAGIIQKNLGTKIQEVDAMLNFESVNKVYIDKSLFVKFSTEVLVTENGWDISEKCAINGVVQIGETSNRTSLIGKILNRLSLLRLYDGYPHEVYGLTPDDAEVENSFFRFITTDSGFDALTSQNITVIFSPLIFEEQFLPDRVEFWNGGVKTDERSVEKVCVPANPFYVRWVNNQGGRDSWMFTTKNVQKKSEITESFKPYVLDQETATTFEETIDSNGSKTIIAGTGHITREDHEVISDIIFSSKIEWYNEKTQKWIELKLDNPVIDKDTTGERSDIELTFVLPEMQIQI